MKKRKEAVAKKFIPGGVKLPCLQLIEDEIAEFKRAQR